jgi:hypothetical protein
MVGVRERRRLFSRDGAGTRETLSKEVAAGDAQVGRETSLPIFSFEVVNEGQE